MCQKARATHVRLFTVLNQMISNFNVQICLAEKEMVNFETNDFAKY